MTNTVGLRASLPIALKLTGQLWELHTLTPLPRGGV